MPTGDEFQVENDNGEMTSSANFFDDVYQEVESSHRRLNVSDSSLFDVEVEWRRDDGESDIVSASE